MQKMYVANKAFIVNPEGKVLLLTDAGVGDHANAKGKWDVPGGRMEQGEHPLDGLKREVKEETGFEPKPDQVSLFFTDKWGVGGDVVNDPIIGLFWIVRVDADPVLSDEHIRFVWHNPNDPLPENTNASVASAMIAYRKIVGHA